MERSELSLTALHARDPGTTSPPASSLSIYNIPHSIGLIWSTFTGALGLVSLTRVSILRVGNLRLSVLDRGEFFSQEAVGLSREVSEECSANRCCMNKINNLLLIKVF